MIKHPESHLDHNLTEAQIDYIMRHFVDRAAFFIESIELPEALGTVSCGLHGPLVGGASVPEDAVTYAKRGTRAWDSRLVDRVPQPSRIVTVIAGPHGDMPCILYTAYGGPLAPQEPGDVRAQIQALERTRRGYNPEVTEAQEAEIHAKIVVLREKRDRAVTFWTEHALSR